MKRALLFVGLISLILVFGLLVVSCNRGGSPQAVVRQLHTAIQRGDANRINQLMVPEAAALTIMFLSKVQRNYAESGGIARMQETITGNTAVVWVAYRNGDTEVFDLVRRDGRWLVTIVK